MGLDTTHDAWHGSYSGFGAWREAVAIAAGLMEPGEKLFPGLDYDTRPVCGIDWAKYDAMTDCYGKWTEEPDDPIFYLLDHSDCEGEIKKRHLLPLADRLEGLLDKLGSEEEQWDRITSDRTKAERFIAGLRLAASENKKVKFH